MHASEYLVAPGRAIGLVEAFALMRAIHNPLSSETMRFDEHGSAAVLVICGEAASAIPALPAA